MCIRYNQQLGAPEAELLELMLSAPSAQSGDVIQRVSDIMSAFLVNAALSFAPSYCSLLAEDVDSLGKRILDGAAHPVGLYADWMETQRIGGGLWLSHIQTRFRENHPNPLTALSIVDPLPFDSEPLTRRILDHFESPGLERILVVAGLVTEKWIDQLVLDVDMEETPDVQLQAMAVVPEDFDFETFASALSPFLRIPMVKKFPELIKARIY